MKGRGKQGFEGIAAEEVAKRGGRILTEKTGLPDLRGTRLRYRAALTGEGPRPEGGVITLDALGFGDLFLLAGMEGEDRRALGSPGDLFLQCGGWLSWSAGWELARGETLPRKVRIIPELIKLTNREGDQGSWNQGSGNQGPKPGGDWLTGHFIMYLRAGDRYLCIASREGGTLPPVSYRISRKRQGIIVETFCPGWVPGAGEVLAEVSVFFVRGFFSLKDALGKLYGQGEIFKKTDFLSLPKGEGAETSPSGIAGPGSGGGQYRDKTRFPGGYESWYNHYTDINEELILEDLAALGRGENLIKACFLDRGRPVVFQIDDGWERAAGDWEVHTGRFPRGLAPVAEKIEQAGYIPGLWFAPFIVTRRARIFREKPEWLLRDREGRPVVAGFNHLWDKHYYCLDLSRRDVAAYLRGLMDRAIDEWGFCYLKLDFLYAGLFSGAFAEGGSPWQHYEKACALLTARTRTAPGGSGEPRPVAYLGCGLPLGPSYRHFPLSRIGADTRETWDWTLVKLLGHVGRPGAYVSLMDTIGRSFLDGTVYLNDPDVVFLRSKNCKLSETEKELIALVNFLLAGQIMFSDDPLRLEPEDISLTARIVKLYQDLAGDEYGAVRIDREVFRLESRSGKTAGLINLRSRPYRLNRQLWPDLYSALAAGSPLTDHRQRIGPGAIVFAPRSITIEAGRIVCSPKVVYGDPQQL
ncbi:MAG: alpha-galactosidase [Treponema sp.]|jgi:alpha-galactosidase|nr:alpha-galactosidase [Treponema sp.]